MLAWVLSNLLSFGDPGIAVPPGIAGTLFSKHIYIKVKLSVIGNTTTKINNKNKRNKSHKKNKLKIANYAKLVPLKTYVFFAVGEFLSVGCTKSKNKRCIVRWLPFVIRSHMKELHFLSLQTKKKVKCVCV